MVALLCFFLTSLAPLFSRGADLRQRMPPSVNGWRCGGTQPNFHSRRSSWTADHMGARVETEAGGLMSLRCKSSRCLSFHCSRRSRQRLLFRFWREVGCPKWSVLTVEDNGNLP